MSLSSSVNTHAFWERLWRTSGMQFAGFLVITCLIYGGQPGGGAPSDALTSFYTGERRHILIAVVFTGLNILNLMWFAEALTGTLEDAGDSWGAAATGSSAAFGGSICFRRQPRNAEVLDRRIYRAHGELWRAGPLALKVYAVQKADGAVRIYV